MIGLIFLIPLLSVPCGFLMQMRYPSAAGPKDKKKMEKEEEKLEMLLCFAYVKVCQVGNKQQGDMCTGAEAKSKVAACSNAVSARRCGRLRCRRWWWWCSHWWLRPTRKVIGPASRKQKQLEARKKRVEKNKNKRLKGGSEDSCPFGRCHFWRLWRAAQTGVHCTTHKGGVARFHFVFLFFLPLYPPLFFPLSLLIPWERLAGSLPALPLFFSTLPTPPTRCGRCLPLNGGLLPTPPSSSRYFSYRCWSRERVALERTKRAFSLSLFTNNMNKWFVTLSPPHTH